MNNLEKEIKEEKLNVTCSKTDCERYGNIPACYNLFYEECKEYLEENEISS